MHLKQRAHCFGVLLVYTITTITLYQSTAAHFALHNDWTSVLNPSSTEAMRRYQTQIENQTTDPSGGESEQSPEPGMVSPLKNGYKRQHTEGELLFTSLNRPSGNCSKGFIKHVVPGKFYISGQIKTNLPHRGYQSDSLGSAVGIRGERFSGSEETWQKMQPVVECGDDAMTLTVMKRLAVQLLLDRENQSSLSLSQLPPQCGYKVQTTWGDLSLIARYDACHITQEDDAYVLPLLWRGTPVKVTCPVSQIKPLADVKSSLCCSPFGMTVKVKGLSFKEEPSMNVRGEWTPLVLLAEQCDYTLDKQDEEIVIAVPFVTCGITVKDEKYTLSLQIGKGIYTLACPLPPAEELPIVHQPLADSPHLIRRSTKPMQESLGPLPWIPPFYLAPPYYPHPTYHQKFAHSKGPDSYNPPAPPSLNPEATLSSQDLPPISSQPSQNLYSHQIPLKESFEHLKSHMPLLSNDQTQDSAQVYGDQKQDHEAPVLDISEKHKVTTTGFAAQVEDALVQPPSHDFSPYYHYYHHPKIPLPGPPEDPSAGVSELLLSTNPHNDEIQSSHSVQQSQDVIDDPEQISPSKTTTHPYTPTASPEFYNKASGFHTPYSTEPFPYFPYYYYYYFPYISRGKAKRLGVLYPDASEKANLSYFHSLPLLSGLPDPGKHTMNPHVNEPKTGKTGTLSNVKSKLVGIKRHSSMTPAGLPPVPQVYPHRPDPAPVPPPKQPSLSSPESIYNNNPYQYYYHPYYGYYLMYYKPENLLGTDTRVSSTSSKTDPSNYKQSTTSPKESMYLKNGLLHPYYYYHFYYQPKVVKDGEVLHPPTSKGSEKTSAKSGSQFPSNYDGMQWFTRTSEARYPSGTLSPHNPFHNFHSYHTAPQHPHGPYGKHGGYDAKEKAHNQMKDQLKANLYTPISPPCGFGPVSDIDCSYLGCCLYNVQDGTVGQYLVFGLPASVVEPKVANPVLPPERSNASCMLHRLNSDPDIYIVPLDGCGVRKHTFGQTEVHLLEVQGTRSNTNGGSHDDSPVSRFMVGCISYPDIPGRLNMMDRPHLPPVQPTQTPLTVLRFATDESFTSYYPETHLPLSVVQNRPIYAELSLLNPSEPNLALLVHSCLAYTLAPYLSWILFYDGCPKQGVSQLLPSPDTPLIRRIKITNFPSLPLESSVNVFKGDPEVYFLCLSEICSVDRGGCSINC